MRKFLIRWHAFTLSFDNVDRYKKVSLYLNVRSENVIVIASVSRIFKGIINAR